MSNKWFRMIAITETVLSVITSGRRRKWTLDSLWANAEKLIGEEVKEYEMRDAIMRLAGRSLVTLPTVDGILVNKTNLKEYHRQRLR